MILYWDRDGKPIEGGVLVWARMLEDPEYRQVAFDQIGDADVSTIWTGLATGLAEVPFGIFETRVRNGDLDPLFIRHSTLQEAQEYHAWQVECLTNSKEE